MTPLYTLKHLASDSHRSLIESRRRRFAAKQRAYEERCRTRGTNPLRITDITIVSMFLILAPLLITSSFT